MSLKKKYNTIIKLGIIIFQNQCNYNQTDLFGKLKNLNKIVGKTSLNHIFTGKRTVGIKTLQTVAEGFCIILKEEKDLIFNESSLQFDPLNTPDFLPNVIPSEAEKPEKKHTIEFFAEGRRSVDKKVELYSSAKKEVIELGVRLKNFSSHFTEQNESRFQGPILKLLQKGVHFRCYILNPKGRFAYPYFYNRNIVQEGELQAFEEISVVKEKLIIIFSELNKQSKKGKMHLYFYNTFPYLHASVVDGETANGAMFIAQYLYGVSRANAPGMSLTRVKNLKLFEKYWKSVQAMISQAEEIPIP